MRAEKFLSEPMPFKDRIKLFLGAGTMGEDEAKKCIFSCVVIGGKKELTSAEDTVRVAGGGNQENGSGASGVLRRETGQHMVC